MSERMQDRHDAIVRYTPGQRANHWMVALCFVLLALSGLALFHPVFWWLSWLFGGGSWARFIHPWIGVVMAVFSLLLALRLCKGNAMQRHDWQWLARLGSVIGKRDDRVPEAGRYNAGQKLIYYAQVLLVLGLLLTGIVMWREYFGDGLFSVGLIRLASLLHALFAVLMICAIIVHVYAAIWVKGSLRAMTRGTVSPGWAWKHHRLWWRSLRDGRGAK